MTFEIGCTSYGNWNITEMGEMDEAPHPHEIEGLKAQKKNNKTKLVKI